MLKKTNNKVRDYDESECQGDCCRFNQSRIDLVQSPSIRKPEKSIMLVIVLLNVYVDIVFVEQNYFSTT